MTAPLFIPATATLQVLDWPEMIAAVREAYSRPLTPAMCPARVVARDGSIWLRTLTAVPGGGRFMGGKMFGLSRKKSVNYLITLIDQDTGEIRGLVDGYHITALRTAATSAVGVDLLAPRTKSSVAVLGSGSEAKSHLRAIAHVREITGFVVYSPTEANREAFVRELSLELGVPGRAAKSPEVAVRDVNIVIAAARSRDESPVLNGIWLEPGMTVVSIGSTLPEQREIDEETVARCDLIVCDMVEEVVDETGDMIAASRAGIAFRDKLVSLNDLVAGQADTRRRAARLPMFKSVGAAVQDIAVAALAFDRAEEAGLAVQLPISFATRRA